VGGDVKTAVMAAGLLCCLPPAASPGQAQNAAGWTLVWSDEFAQPDGSAPDSSKWTYDLGAGGWGNGEWQYYTSRTNNARVENGQLVIEAHRETYETSGYTSARLKTLGHAAWTYGRVEARIKIPRGQGLWPAFWMLGTNVTVPAVGWPNCGEIDIMENIGREPTLIHGTIHGPGYSGGGSVGAAASLPGNPNFADDFHLYAVEWATNQLKWFVDGLQYFSATPASLPNGADWVFTQPQFLLLNVAVGGNWPGYPDGTTTFPQRLSVDYVRVYALIPLPACATNGLANPGFETGGLANWTIYGGGGNTSLGGIKSLPVRTGSNVFKVYGQFNGSDNLSGLYQELPATAGQVFTAGGWALTPVGDAIAGANTAWIEVSFRNASSAVLTAYRSAPVNTSTPPGLWWPLAVTNQIVPGTGAVLGPVANLAAPPNTASVRYQVVFRQPAMAAGAVLFDDLRLTQLGATGLPVSFSATRRGNNLCLAFPTCLDVPYQIRWKVRLSETPWQVLTNLTGNGGVLEATVDMPPPSGFFQVSRLCDGGAGPPVANSGPF
jgi:beta-glucanase (GH16 family)